MYAPVRTQEVNNISTDELNLPVQNSNRTKFLYKRFKVLAVTAATLLLLIYIVYFVIIFILKRIPPRYQEAPGLLYLLATSDALITLSYFLTPISLVWFVKERRDLPFHWIFLQFGGFIMFCGLTHFLNIFSPWLLHAETPINMMKVDYVFLQGAAWLKLATGIISFTTSLTCIYLVPAAVSLPSPEDLRKMIKEKEKAQHKLQKEYQRSLLIASITSKIRNTLNSSEIFRTAAVQIGASLNVCRCTIHRLEEEPANNHPSQQSAVNSFTSSPSSSPTSSHSLETTMSIPVEAEYTRPGINIPSCKEMNLHYDNEFIQRVLSTNSACIIYTDQADETENETMRSFLGELRKVGITSAVCIRTSYLGVPNGLIMLHSCKQPERAVDSDEEDDVSSSPSLSDMHEITIFEDDSGEDNMDMFYHDHRVMKPHDRGFWTRKQIRLLEEVAGQIGIGLAQSYLLEQERQRHLLELENIELEKAREAAERENKAKTEFLTMMSHEIRTPLNAIIGMNTLLQQTSLNSEQQQCVSIIHDSSKLLLFILNSFLDFSKVTSGKLELEYKPFNVRTCIEKAIRIFTINAQQHRNISIETIEKSPLPEFALGDKYRLRQVILNLIANAVKFTHDGGKITVLLENISLSASSSAVGLDSGSSSPLFKMITKPYYHLKISIKDTGIGIAEEKLQRLFQPFTQIDSSLSRKYQGTGLGLVISKKLVELMGGSIWVKSKIGEGSTFSFTVKLSKFDRLTGEDAVSLYRKKKQNEEMEELEAVAESNKDLRNINYAATQRDILHSIVTASSPTVAAASDATFKLSPAALMFPGTKEQRGSGTPSAFQSFTEHQKQAALEGPALTVLKPNASESATRRRSSTSLDFSTRILIAEDNPVNQKVVVSLLKKIGFERIDVVENGLLAVQAIQKYNIEQTQPANGTTTVSAASSGPYRILILDLSMPVMDGIAAAAAIRQIFQERKTTEPKRLSPYIIALTASIQKEIQQRCMEVGFNDFLAKPVKYEELRTVVSKYASLTDTKTLV